MYSNQKIKEENYLKDIIKFIKRKRKEIALITIAIFLLIVTGVILVLNKTYETSSSLIVDVDEATSDYSNLVVGEDLVDTYTEFIVSNTVIQEVIDLLGLDLTTTDVKEMVSVTNSSNTIIINITVSGSNPDILADIANALVEVTQELDKHYIGTNSVLVLDYAITPTSTSSTSILVYGFISIIVSIGLSFAIVFAYNLIYNRIEFKEQIEEELGINYLGKILDYRYTLNDEVKKGRNQIITKIDPMSYISESYNLIAERIDLLGIDNPIKVINVVSQNPREGKTLTAVNLAQVYSATNKKTLIIDLDLYKSTVHRFYNIERTDGITDYFKDNLEKIEDYIVKVDSNLSYLSGGSSTEVFKKVLSSETFKDMMENLKVQYDIIIIDCPPLSAVLDGELVSLNCDGTLLVVKSRTNEIDKLKNVVENLNNLGVNILGGVITNAKKVERSKLDKNYYRN